MRLRHIFVRLNDGSKATASIQRWRCVSISWWGTHFGSSDKKPRVLKSSTSVDFDITKGFCKLTCYLLRILLIQLAQALII